VDTEAAFITAAMDFEADMKSELRSRLVAAVRAMLTPSFTSPR
jgi:hypothetical protein